MPRSISSRKYYSVPSFSQLCRPLNVILPMGPQLTSRCNRPLQMDFEHHLKALIFFHLEEHTSGRHLIQVLQEDDFARNNIAPPDGIHKSAFFEAMSERGLDQFLFVFQELQKTAAKILPQKFPELGNLVAIDGSLIDSVLSMEWACYRDGSKKAKTHIGFDVNRSIPKQIFLTDGNGGERPFVDQILDPGDTGIMDRGYPEPQGFRSLANQGKALRLQDQGEHRHNLPGKLPATS